MPPKTVCEPGISWRDSESVGVIRVKTAPYGDSDWYDGVSPRSDLKTRIVGGRLVYRGPMKPLEMGGPDRSREWALLMGACIVPL